MGRRKSVKKEEFNDLSNCINADETIASRWAEHFGNDKPIILELGCGKGDLAFGLARRYPDHNYIGVDIKATRMWTGAWRALEEGVENLAFLRCDIHALDHYFAEHEVAGIWITFPDPYPRKKHSKNRMIHERFLARYVRIMQSGGLIEFKTDNKSLFQYTHDHFNELNDKEVYEIDILHSTRDLHRSEWKDGDAGITTDFERRFLEIDKTINYMKFAVSPGKNFHKMPVTEGVSLDPTEKAPRLRN